MSWLFGYSSTPPPPSDVPPADSGGSAAPPTNLTKSEKKAMEAYRFDSSALERAAQAARELERSSKCIKYVIINHIARYCIMRPHNLTDRERGLLLIKTYI